jgi:hypothetical protein
MVKLDATVFPSRYSCEHTQLIVIQLSREFVKVKHLSGLPFES